MITKQDITKLTKIFATKQEMNDRFIEMENKIRVLFLERFDEVMFELKTIREEQVVGGYRQAEHSDQLENHEGRITKLESGAL
ncbi:MAG: hypothetical protein ABII10_02355 [Candidatus Paceibacterota bacterium]